MGASGDEANGASLTADLCATCHGADGTGMPPGLVSETSDLQDKYAAMANATNFLDLP